MTRAGDEPCLVVFARAPVAGQVKTRLCTPVAAAEPGAPAALTAEQAAAVHAAFVSDVCRTGKRSGIPRRRLYVAGDAAHPQLVGIARDHGFAIRAQAGADLGARMAAAIADELAAGASAVVLVGTDSPTLPPAYLQRAAAWLGDGAEVVLGPAADGGYYLVGARRPLPQLFAAGISWGTPQVLPATLLRLRELAATGTRVALLPFFYDVDTPQDLWLLACHLRLAAAQAPAAEPSEAAQPDQAEQGNSGTRGSAHPVADASTVDAARTGGGPSAADLAAMDALTRLHAPATCAVLAALGWLEAAAPAPGSPEE